MNITIESGIPTPTRARYPIASMNVGDSFVVDANKKNGVYTTAKRLGAKVVIRSIGEGKVRVWKSA